MKTKIYNKWCNMKARCNNPNDHHYKYYGGRGITICNEWVNDFQAFEEWALKNGYSDNLELDRIDNNGIYEPKNCRFITKKQNANNKRNNIVLTINDITKSVNDWAKESGLPRNTIVRRINLGWDNKDLLLPSKLGNNQYSKHREG
jgi:hypothetical protein